MEGCDSVYYECGNQGDTISVYSGTCLTKFSDLVRIRKFKMYSKRSFVYRKTMKLSIVKFRVNSRLKKMPAGNSHKVIHLVNKKNAKKNWISNQLVKFWNWHFPQIDFLCKSYSTRCSTRVLRIVVLSWPNVA